MNLVERYIQAVKIELPAPQREDIARELKSTIQDELDAMTERHGRSPTDTETSEYLQRLGHPVRVASTYWTRRSLVSEDAYPLYKQALVLAVCVYIVISVLTSAPEIGQAQGWGLVYFPKFLFDLLSTVLFGVVAVTLVFHYFGDQIAAQPFFWRWNPEHLPNLSNLAASLPRSETVSALISNIFALSLLTFGSLGWSTPSFTVEFSAGAAALMVLRLLVLIDFALNLLNLAQPYWTRSKLLVNVGLHLAVAFCLVQLMLLPQVLVISSTTRTIDPSMIANNNLSIKITLGIVLLIVIYSAWKTVRRVWPIKLPWY